MDSFTTFTKRHSTVVTHINEKKKKSQASSLNNQLKYNSVCAFVYI